MRKEFYLKNGKIMINFTEKYCDTSEKLLESSAFKTLLAKYLEKSQRKNTSIYKYIKHETNITEIDQLTYSIANLFKLLMVFKAEDIKKIDINLKSIFDSKDKLILFVEDLYRFWRKIERYTIIHDNKPGEGFQDASFIDSNIAFSQLILDTYRKIEENIISHKPQIYRQLPAGGNAGLILNDLPHSYSEDYKCLQNIPFIKSIMLDPPFITYPKMNTRTGMFTECFENPLKQCTIKYDHWFCYPAKVGDLLAYIYFHRDFMAHGITLCNLFEIAKESEYANKKPDIVYVFGARDSSKQMRTIFYDDKKNNIMLGYINYNESIDYFGYMKKMTLTLHNLIMIKREYLPIHGAMVNIVTKDNKTANIIIMGDSGAGKSETLEAFRQLGDEYISDMKIIFDDMGTVRLDEKGCISAYGTEIGAFVRLDDLDSGYAFKEIDRSIFMNPDKINARLVIPVSSYTEITTGYPVNLFLYANNYEDKGSELEFFNNCDTAIKVFKDGARMAKGTTSEKGLVKTYFANPFGPAQKSEDTGKLLNIYFNRFFKSGVKVGQLRTRLGISGKEKTGPKKAALVLLEEIKHLQN
ncbi:phosphoenolpyruvate carboxykinase [Clostridium tyrobutyricum]|uniref:phosphoenolpyruvate carboxykinase n=1 Tax=Clostridium tyrobutyricum TaxID=1519 RepID=UPI001C384029|nr:phosphoenolpyruvate carboxykinase [Clostridium tyrobutyricum]MBV4419718.1 phosphoenolpyruvate carboxykinase [Clostridium tyrobutyricum]